MSLIERNPQLIKNVLELSEQASESILDIYNNSKFDFEIKEDSSPITEADIKSHKILVSGLKKIFPKIPILSEEESNISFNIRSKWDRYWLIDPLDGTKEFINRNGEFTVNIALIDNKQPIFGLINIPEKNKTYWGSEFTGSYLINEKNKTKRIMLSQNREKEIRIVVSRSHPSDALSKVLQKIKNYRLVKAGSSLKFCMLAEGKADIYPRLGPTNEWDIAAGIAILKFAGGISSSAKGDGIVFNSKESYLIENFLASRNNEIHQNTLEIISTLI